MRLVLGGSSRSNECAVTLLPQPDSPTSPSVSPGLMSNVTPSTARTTPSWVKKWVLQVFDLEHGLHALDLRDAVSGGQRSSHHRVRVGGVAQAVAKEVERQHGAGDDDDRA